MDEVKNYPPYLDYPKPRRKQTRADQIRGMSDRELADVFRRVPECPEEYYTRCASYETCQECWINWLQQPMEDE